MEPTARQVERVAGLEHEIEHRHAGSAELRPVPLVAQRELDGGLVDEPALAARDLEDEDVVRVVVDGEALRPARREVRVRLHGVAEQRLELARVHRERRPVQVEALEHDRRAGLVLRRDDPDPSRPGEGHRPPGDVGRVVADVELFAGLDEAERRMAETGVR